MAGFGHAGHHLGRAAAVDLDVLDPFRQGHTADQVADDENRIVFTSDFVHSDNVWMPQLRGRASLAEELINFRRVQLPFAGNLDGDNAIQFRITGLPDGAEPSQSDPRDQFKPSDLFQHRSLTGFFLAIDQAERTAAGGTFYAFEGTICHDFDGVAAVGATNVQTARTGRRT